jgi:hypothetical protein
MDTRQFFRMTIKPQMDGEARSCLSVHLCIDAILGYAMGKSGCRSSRNYRFNHISAL